MAKHEVNKIKAGRITCVPNLLALVAQQQPVYNSQNHPIHYSQNSSTRLQQAATRNKGKAIVNSPQPIYDQEPSMVAEDDEMSKDRRLINDNSPRINRSVGYENQRIGNFARARETVGSTVVQKFRIQCYNCKEFGHVARECQKPKRAKDAAYHREKMLLYAQIVIIDSLDMNYDRKEIDQNDDDNDLSKEQLARRNSMKYVSQMELECAKVRGDFLSYKMESQKSCTKYTETINDLNQAILEMKDKLSAHQETISILSQQKEAQIKLYKTQEDKELDKVIKLEHKLKVLDNIVYKTGQLVQMMNMLNRNCKISFAKPEFLKKAQRVNPCLYDIESMRKVSLMFEREMVADLRYFNSLKVEVDSLKSQLETQKTQFLNEIDLLSREYYYADHMNAILGVYTELDEVTYLQCDYLETLEKCECLEKELSKSKMMSKNFEALQEHAINLELDLQQCKEKIKK
nr:hypothetical protein [Tanacetum cinerariifolium]